MLQQMAPVELPAGCVPDEVVGVGDAHGMLPSTGVLISGSTGCAALWGTCQGGEGSSRGTGAGERRAGA